MPIPHTHTVGAYMVMKKENLNVNEGKRCRKMAWNEANNSIRGLTFDSDIGSKSRKDGTYTMLIKVVMVPY